MSVQWEMRYKHPNAKGLLQVSSGEMHRGRHESECDRERERGTQAETKYQSVRLSIQHGRFELTELGTGQLVQSVRRFEQLCEQQLRLFGDPERVRPVSAILSELRECLLSAQQHERL